MKTSSRPRFEPRGFSSAEEKFEFLFRLCEGKKGQLVGVDAAELLTFGGSKHIMWVDVDESRSFAFEAWVESSSFPFPPGSWVDVPSSTGKHHLYVVTDRPLANEECFGMMVHVARTCEDYELLRNVDRIYGPSVRMPIYIPFCSVGKPRLPQVLVEELTDVYVIPSDLPRIPFAEWSARKREFWNDEFAAPAQDGMLSHLSRMHSKFR